MSLRITDQEEERVSFWYETTNIRQANKVRRLIFQEVRCLAIDIVIFQTNTSLVPDELIAHRLGQLVVTSSSSLTGHLSVRGPALVTSQDLRGVSSPYFVPVCFLQSGQQLDCQVVVREGTGQEHGKWRPVSVVTFSPREGGFLFTMELTGSLSGEEIISQVRELLS